MPAPFSLTLGGSQFPWVRGLNTAKRASELAPNEAQTATNLDMTAGTLRGSWSPGTAISDTVAASAKFIACAANTDWVSSIYPAWGNLFTALGTNTLLAFTYPTGASTYDTLRGRYSGTTYKLGIPAPLTDPTIAGGARANRSYAIVFAGTLYDTVYSNPSSIVTAAGGATLSSIPQLSSASSYSIAGNYFIQVYATEEGDPDGILYYYKDLLPGTTSWTDTGGYRGAGNYSVDVTQPLTWGVGGSIDSATTPHDYTPASAFWVLAEETFGGQGDAGILFAGIGTQIQWCHTGKPWAWPAAQRHDVQATVEAIVVYQGSAYAFTASSVWSFSGGADYAITPVRMSAAHPIKAGFGKSAKATPYGILYVAREGIALFDGVTSRIISKGVLDPQTFLGGATYGNAAFHDGIYRLNLWGTGTMICVEFDAEGGIRFTKNTAMSVSGLTVTDKPTGNAGLFVADMTTGALKPWRVADGSAVTGSTRSTWAWVSPLLTMDAPGRLKNFRRCRVACDLNGGSLAVKIDVSDAAGDVPGAWPVTTFTETITDSQDCLFWLPSELKGQAATITLTPSSGNVELYEVTLEGEVCNGA